MAKYLVLIFFIPFCIYSQQYDFSKQWVFLGPSDKPDSPNNNSASGVGPIEFVRIFKSNPKHLLAGSLSGGLFFSEDGGENWINSGSDAWPYSGCAWADFLPSNHANWFAYSNIADNNGKPGKMGLEGGIYRTKNSGTNWQLIANSNDFKASAFMTVYGFRFHPKNEKVMFVLTDEGLFYTQDCLAEKVEWLKVPNVQGVIYDLDFLDESVYVSNHVNDKWNVLRFNLDNYTSHKALVGIEEIFDKLRTITFEPRGNKLLVLVDFANGSDALYEFNEEDESLKKLLSNQQVNFGSGHTFAVSPHNENEFIIGYSTHIKKWNYNNLKEEKLGSGYHVDVEFIAYDPIDTQKIVMACHGGIYISNDNGLTWQNKSKGLGVAEVMGMDVSESDPNQIVIGTFHDGSSVLADFNKDGNYFWRTVNGGDALTPLIHNANPAVVYTSTQFTGGGIYHSIDTAKNFVNVHNQNGFNTSGWELSAALHPVEANILFFNFAPRSGENKNNTDIARTNDAANRNTAEVISDFKKTHQLESYKVYGIFNNQFFPDHLYAYVLHADKDEDGNRATKFRLFRTECALDSAHKVVDSWYELEVPLNTWIGDVEGDPSNPNVVYISYSSGRDVLANPEFTTGIIYMVKYNKKNHNMKRDIDISRNLPNTIAGRFNLACSFNEGKEMFIATRSGVYYGNKKTLKGKYDWQPVGFGLPHCKVYRLHYHQKDKLLTIGFLGRGVWRYYLN